MTQNFRPVLFPASGRIQSHVVPLTGNHVIVAAGAQGGAGKTAGGLGAMVEGMFYLRQGEVLHVVVGLQGGAGWTPGFAPDLTACGGGGGGGTFIWKTTPQGTLPSWPILVAAGGGGGGHVPGGAGRAGGDALPNTRFDPVSRVGKGGLTDPCWHFAGGGGTGWLSPGTNGPGPTYCEGGRQWDGGEGLVYGDIRGGNGGFGGGGGGGFLGHACGGGGGFGGGAGGGLVDSRLHWMSPSEGGISYNAGRHQINRTGAQAGDGFATITAAVVPAGQYPFPRFLSESLFPIEGVAPRPQP